MLGMICEGQDSGHSQQILVLLTEWWMMVSMCEGPSGMLVWMGESKGSSFVGRFW